MKSLYNDSLILKALEYIGEKEVPGPDTNPVFQPWYDRWVPDGIIKDDSRTAWCSIFMNQIAWELGLEYTGKLNAQSWLEVGEEIEWDDMLPGDVLVYWRGNPNSWMGHTHLYIRHTETHIWGLGGNQGNSVTISPYSKTRLKGIRRLRPSYRM